MQQTTSGMYKKEQESRGAVNVAYVVRQKERVGLRQTCPNIRPIALGTLRRRPTTFAAVKYEQIAGSQKRACINSARAA